MKFIIPTIIILIIFVGIKNKINVYQVFIEGVSDGLKTVLGIFPVILAITMSVSMLRASGLMELLTDFLSPVLSLFKIPEEIIPLAIIRPLSGGGALGILTDILKEYGPDSFIGLCASVIMGSTETTFYTLMVYFRNTRVKYSSYIIPAALFGDIVGVIAGTCVCLIFF